MSWIAGFRYERTRIELDSRNRFGVGETAEDQDDEPGGHLEEGGEGPGEDDAPADAGGGGQVPGLVPGDGGG